MKATRIIMGMPVTIEIVADARHTKQTDAERTIEKTFDYFIHIDETFSTYKTASEISLINAGTIAPENRSGEMKEVFALAERTKQESHGYFDIKKADGTIDPSGIVKGWAIRNAAQMIAAAGFENFYVDAGGDIQTHGKNAEGKKWAVGIKNPWNEKENIKVVHLSGEGIATSGTYIRGEHIYDPHDGHKPPRGVASMTVIAADVCEADRFATAAFAMGRKGIQFIGSLSGAGFAGYMIDDQKLATLTDNFEHYTKE